jgi:hypothetical protein
LRRFFVLQPGVRVKRVQIGRIVNVDDQFHY